VTKPSEDRDGGGGVVGGGVVGGGVVGGGVASGGVVGGGVAGGGVVGGRVVGGGVGKSIGAVGAGNGLAIIELMPRTSSFRMAGLTETERSDVSRVAASATSPSGLDIERNAGVLRRP
jgi:hypothetical protein